MAKTEGRTYANYVCALAPLALPGVMNIRTTKQPISKNYRGDFPPQRKNDKPLGWPVFDRRRRLPCWSGNHRRKNRRDSRLPAKGRCRICRIVPAGWCARVGDRPGETLERSRAIREAEKFHRRP